MDNVVFEDEYRTQSGIRGPQGLTGWFLRHGIVRTESQASTLLLIIGLIIMTCAILVLTRSVTDEPFTPEKHFVPAYTN